MSLFSRYFSYEIEKIALGQLAGETRRPGIGGAHQGGRSAMSTSTAQTRQRRKRRTERQSVAPAQPPPQTGGTLTGTSTAPKTIKVEGNLSPAVATPARVINRPTSGTGKGSGTKPKDESPWSSEYSQEIPDRPDPEDRESWDLSWRRGLGKKQVTPIRGGALPAGDEGPRELEDRGGETRRQWMSRTGTPGHIAGADDEAAMTGREREDATGQADWRNYIREEGVQNRGTAWDRAQFSNQNPYEQTGAQLQRTRDSSRQAGGWSSPVAVQEELLAGASERGRQMLGGSPWDATMSSRRSFSTDEQGNPLEPDNIPGDLAQSWRNIKGVFGQGTAGMPQFSSEGEARAYSDLLQQHGDAAMHWAPYSARQEGDETMQMGLPVLGGFMQGEQGIAARLGMRVGGRHNYADPIAEDLPTYPSTTAPSRAIGDPDVEGAPVEPGYTYNREGERYVDPAYLSGEQLGAKLEEEQRAADYGLGSAVRDVADLGSRFLGGGPMATSNWAPYLGQAADWAMPSALGGQGSEFPTWGEAGDPQRGHSVSYMAENMPSESDARREFLTETLGAEEGGQMADKEDTERASANEERVSGIEQATGVSRGDPGWDQAYMNYQLSSDRMRGAGAEDIYAGVGGAFGTVGTGLELPGQRPGQSVSQIREAVLARDDVPLATRRQVATQMGLKEGDDRWPS